MALKFPWPLEQADTARTVTTVGGSRGNGKRGGSVEHGAGEQGNSARVPNFRTLKRPWLLLLQCGLAILVGGGKGGEGCTHL